MEKKTPRSEARSISMRENPFPIKAFWEETRPGFLEWSYFLSCAELWNTIQQLEFIPNIHAAPRQGAPTPGSKIFQTFLFPKPCLVGCTKATYFTAFLHRYKQKTLVLTMEFGVKCTRYLQRLYNKEARCDISTFCWPYISKQHSW